MKRFNKLSSYFNKQSTVQAIFLLNILITTVFSAWYVLHGDVVFRSDVARDFLLLDEIEEKKIVLLGPRASGLPGLFHGPLWLYLQMPAYLLGQGNPVFVGWFWVVLAAAATLGLFVITRRLFGSVAAWIAATLASSFLMQEVNGLFNPHGAFFVLPLLVYSLIKYKETGAITFLLIHYFVIGLIIQFQIAIGLPMFLLTLPIVAYYIWKSKKYVHAFSIFVLFIPLASYVLFELRHNFPQLRAVLGAYDGPSHYPTPMINVINQRVSLVTSDGFQVFRSYFSFLNVALLILIVNFYSGIAKVSKKLKFRYWMLLWLFAGYFLSSILFKGVLLQHHWFPISVVAFMLIGAIVKTYNQKIILAFGVLLFIQNIILAYDYVQDANSIIGKRFDSWKFLSSVTEKVLSDQEKEFGYFTFTPDFYAYGPKYAFLYQKKKHPELSMGTFTKKEITYVTYEPPPENRDDIVIEGWSEKMLNILSEPVEVYTFSNGYLIEKYHLTASESASQIDSSLDPGAYFR